MGFLNTDIFLLVLIILNILLIIFSILSVFRIKKIYKNEKIFMEKLGDGKNIKEDLNNYINRVAISEEEIRKLSLYYKGINNKLENCIQKVGVVRYNAYRDTGSDLSFAVCLLDDNNNGVVFNGIYSRDMSNTYAKPIENGTSRYIITPEEQDAINRAMNN